VPFRHDPPVDPRDDPDLFQSPTGCRDNSDFVTVNLYFTHETEFQTLAGSQRHSDLAAMLVILWFFLFQTPAGGQRHSDDEDFDHIMQFGVFQTPVGNQSDGFQAPAGGQRHSEALLPV
jgi:hypothetical protein